MKSNKSFLKRLKVTKTGKVLARKPGQNHFNAKESGRFNLHKGRKSEWEPAGYRKVKSRFLGK